MTASPPPGRTTSRTEKPFETLRTERLVQVALTPELARAGRCASSYEIRNSNAANAASTTTGQLKTARRKVTPPLRVRDR